MKTCNDVEKLLPYLLKGELDGEELAEARLHVSFCPSCKAAYERELELSDLIKSVRAKEEPAPKRLETKIVKRIAALEKEERPSPIFGAAWRVAASAAASVAIVHFAMFISNDKGSSRDETEALFSEASLRHAKSRPLEIKTEDPQSVLSWFDGKVDFGLPQIPVQNAAIKIEGGRLTHVKNHQAAQIVFRSPMGSRMSLLVYENQGKFKPAEAKSVNMKGKNYYISRAHGFNVVTWKDEDLLYTLVGQEQPDSLINFVGIR